MAVDATTDSAVPVSTTESAAPLAVAEKPKPVRKPRQKKVVEPVAVDATTDSAAPLAVAEKPKPVRKPRQKKVVEPVAVDATTDSAEVPEEPSNNSEKKVNAMTAVNTLISAVTLPNVTMEAEPAQSNVTMEAEPAQSNVTMEAEPVPDVEDEVKPSEEEEEEEEEEIQAKIINYEGQQYLLDDNFNIYDKESFDEIGKFDAETQKIVFN